MTDENPLETKNLAFFGTLAVDGTCSGIVVNTGDRTVFGRIAGLAAGSVSDVTTLQLDIHHFVIIISSVAIFLGILFFIIGLAKGTKIITNVVFCIGIIVATFLRVSWPLSQCLSPCLPNVWPRSRYL